MDILHGIVLDRIWPVAWAYEALHGALDFAFLAGLRILGSDACLIVYGGGPGKGGYYAVHMLVQLVADLLP